MLAQDSHRDRARSTTEDPNGHVSDGATRQRKIIHIDMEVACVHYPPLLPADHPTQKLMERQSSSAGSTFSFDVKGDQADAFAFLNRLQVFKLGRCSPT